MKDEALKIDPIVRKPSVLKAIGISNATLYAWIKDGIFPKPLRLGGRATGWRVSAINAWIDSRTYTDGKRQKIKE